MRHQRNKPEIHSVFGLFLETYFGLRSLYTYLFYSPVLALYFPQLRNITSTNFKSIDSFCRQICHQFLRGLAWFINATHKSMTVILTWYVCSRNSIKILYGFLYSSCSHIRIVTLHSLLKPSSSELDVISATNQINASPTSSNIHDVTSHLLRDNGGYVASRQYLQSKLRSSSASSFCRK